MTSAPIKKHSVSVTADMGRVTIPLNLVRQERVRNGRAGKTHFCIVDAQRVMNDDSAQCKGYDAGKKVPGLKRHLALDTQCLPYAIEVTTTNVNDRQGAVLLLLINADTLLDAVKIPFTWHVDMILGADVEIAQQNKMHRFAVIAKRWIVERPYAWLDKCKRLWKSRNCIRASRWWC